MSNRTSIALWRQSFRLLAWLIAAYFIVGVAGVLIAFSLSFGAEEGNVATWLMMPLLLALVLVPFAIAFLFGRDLRDRESVSAGAAAMTGLGGGGLLILVFLLIEFLWLSLDAGLADVDAFGRRAIAYLLMILLTAGIAALGAWWEGRRS